MWLHVFLLVAGIALILLGANLLTDGASAVARRCGISDLVTGLTVVAFGTSTPELVIGLMSAFNGSSELAVGNVVGSNIFNILVILGITALIRPVKIERSVMNNEIPLVLLAAVVLFVMGNGPFLDKASSMMLSRVDGIVLLLFFAVFMRYTFANARDASSDDPVAENAASKPAMKWIKAIAYILLGLGGLVLGGDWFVDGASGIASGLGVSEAIIGLTIVAAGSSLPELATSVTAAIKGKPGIAVGNVIGSNIFNIFLVLGCTATVRPLSFGTINNADLLVLVGSSVAFWFFARFFKDKTITRPEGGILVVGYILYTVWLIMNVNHG